tara:strand:+ start:328 stop:576 length:249 start_codon:yes stop_codon:yes gene_type:complete
MTNPDVTYALLGASDAISDHAFSYVSDQIDGVDTTLTFCKNCGGANAYEADSTTAATANLTNHTSECVIRKILELINMETTE